MDLYIDDTGYDRVHANPQVCVCAARAYKVWEEVKANLAEARLPVSVEKTAWVCNNRAPQNALEKYLQENDPKVKDVYKRLGPGFGW